MNLNTALVSVEDFYRRIYWDAPSAITHHTRDYTLSYSGIKWMHSVNQLWMHNNDALDDELLDLACEFFKRYNAEYSVVYTDDRETGASGLLAQKGFNEHASSPIYVLNGLPRPANMNREARIERASMEHQDQLKEILMTTFFIGPEACRCVVRPEHFSDPTIRHYLAFVNGEAAACATIMLDGNIAGVWNVGTLRPFRRQGLAAAILMRALADAASDGYQTSVLMASPMGKALYEDMGYQLIGYSHHYGTTE